MSELNGLSLLAYSLAPSLNFKGSPRVDRAENEDANVPAHASAHRRRGHDVREGTRSDRRAGCDSRPCNRSAVHDPENAAALTFARAEKAAIYIRTREGDTVALRIASRDSLSAKARVDDAGVSELSVAGRSSTKVAVLVHGDLNPDELAAIQDVVDQASALADKFFSGDVQGAFAAAADLDIDGTELAKVGLRLSMHEEAGYAALGSGRGASVASPTARSGAADATEAAGAPAANDASDSTSASVSGTAEPPGPALATHAAAETNAPAETEHALVETTDVPAETMGAPAETMDAPAETTHAPAETTGAPPAGTTDDAAESDAAAKTRDAMAATGSPVTGAASVLATIGAFLHDLLEAFAVPAGEGGVQSSVSLDLSLKIRIFQSFVLAASSPSGSVESSGAAPGDAAESPSPGVLSDTLDAFAAQQQPPLDAVA